MAVGEVEKTPRGAAFILKMPFKKGMPPQADESAVDFRIALDLLAPLSERGGDVVQKRGEQIRKILETEAFQRKKQNQKITPSGQLQLF